MHRCDLKKLHADAAANLHYCGFTRTSTAASLRLHAFLHIAYVSFTLMPQKAKRSDTSAGALTDTELLSAYSDTVKLFGFKLSSSTATN